MRLPGPNLNLDRTSVRFNRFRFRTSVQNRTSASLLGFTSQVQPITAPVLPPEKPIKTEIFAPLIAEIKKTIIETVKTAHTPARDDRLAIIEVPEIQPIFADPN